MSDDFDDFEQVPEPTDGENGLVKGLRGNVDKATRQRDQAREEARTAKTELALYRSGLSDLPELQREAVLKMHAGDITPEALLGTAVALGFAQAPPPPEPTPAEVSAQTQQTIAQATAGAGSVQTEVITPETVASWGMERRIAYMRSHPNEWEMLKRGEEVTGLPV